MFGLAWPSSGISTTSRQLPGSTRSGKRGVVFADGPKWGFFGWLPIHKRWEVPQSHCRKLGRLTTHSSLTLESVMWKNLRGSTPLAVVYPTSVVFAEDLERRLLGGLCPNGGFRSGHVRSRLRSLQESAPDDSDLSRFVARSYVTSGFVARFTRIDKSKGSGLF